MSDASITPYYSAFQTTKYKEFFSHFISLGEATSEVLNPFQVLPPLNASA